MANMINHIFLTITYFLGNFWSKKTIFGSKNSENVRKKWFSALRKSKKIFFFQQFVIVWECLTSQFSLLTLFQAQKLLKIKVNIKKLKKNQKRRFLGLKILKMPYFFCTFCKKSTPGQFGPVVFFP
jgi:hypothetical protein